MISKPALLELPVPITTPRLILKPPAPGEGKRVNDAIAESSALLEKWTLWAHPMPSAEETEEYGRVNAAEWILRKELVLWIWDRASGEFVGGTGLHSINWYVPCVEIGYWIRTSRSGQGLVTEAVNALTRYAFEVITAKRVEIRCDKDNLKSRAIPERLGFKLDVVLERNDIKPDRSPRDTCVFSRLSSAGLPKLKVLW